MTSKIQPILIDPEAREISIVTNWEPLKWGWNQEQACGLIDASSLDSFRIPALDGSWDRVWVDDVGLYTRKKQWFAPNLYGHPLAGRALVFGEGPPPDGESLTPFNTLAHLQLHILWEEKKPNAPSWVERGFTHGS